MLTSFRCTVAFVAISVFFMNAENAFCQEKDATIAKVRAALADLQTKRVEMLSRYEEKHPQVQQVDSQIQLLKGLLTKQIDMTDLKANEKREQLSFEIDQLTLERESLKQKLGSGHPKIKMVEQKIDYWKTLIDKLPKQSQQNAQEKLLVEAVKMLEDFQATQDSEKKKHELSEEEQRLRRQIESLIKAQRAAEAKRAMEFILGNAKSELESRNRALDLTKKAKESEKKAQDALLAAQKNTKNENFLLKRKNAELVEMQDRLKQTEIWLTKVQEAKAKQGKSQSSNTKLEGSIGNKLHELDERMARMEKMLKVIAEKLERKDK